MNSKSSPELNNSIDITVIIPAFNIEKYLAEAIDSALAQIPPFAQIIIVDDGSTDNTSAIALSYTNAQVQYHFQTNQGLGPARNTGLRLARSQFIYFMDGDDILVPGLTAAFIEAQKHLPATEIFAFSAVDFEDSSKEILPSSKFMRRMYPGAFANGEDSVFFSIKHQPLLPCAFLYIFNRSAIEGEKYLRFENILHEDELFTPALFFNGGTTVISTTVYYRRRVRAGSIMTSRATERNVEGTLRAASWWFTKATSYSGAKAYHLKVQAHLMYGLAVRHASRARLGTQAFKALVIRYTPYFEVFSSFDYFISGASKSFAFSLAKIRARLLSRL